MQDDAACEMVGVQKLYACDGRLVSPKYKYSNYIYSLVIAQSGDGMAETVEFGVDDAGFARGEALD